MGWGDDNNGWNTSDAWGETKQEEPTNTDTRRKRFKKEEQDGGGKAEEKEERPAPYKPADVDIAEEAELQASGTGENFQRYKDHKVTCLPPDIVNPIEKFEDLITSSLLLENIKSLKYAEMTPIQKWAMPTIMKGMDIIGCAQTGSGKTAAFLLPVLQTLLNTNLDSVDPNSDCQNPYCLIISPTRELANQIYINATMLSKDSIVRSLVIYGQIATFHLKAKLSMGVHILVATPGRLKDFVERGWIGFKNIKFVILDEGDRLVDEGFSTDIRNFFNHPTMPSKENRQTLFFSATFKNQTQMNAKEYLKDDFIFLTVGRVGAANEDIKQEFLRVSRQEKKRELKKILDTIPEDEKTIIFTQTKSIADVLAGYFSVLNLSATSIHGDRHQSQREEAIRAFKKGLKRFLISSPVGNRGLDLPKVGLVINYDLPSNVDEYVHRIGRTGRAGHTGRAISFYDDERDKEILPDLVEILKEAKQDIPDWMTGQEQPKASNEGSWGGSDANVSKPADDNWGNDADDDWGNPAKDDGWGNSKSEASETKTTTVDDDDGWN